MYPVCVYLCVLVETFMSFRPILAPKSCMLVASKRVAYGRMDGGAARGAHLLAQGVGKRRG